MKKVFVKGALHRIKADFTGVKEGKGPNLAVWFLVLFVLVKAVLSIIRAVNGTLTSENIFDLVQTIAIVSIGFVIIFISYYEKEKAGKQ